MAGSPEIREGYRFYLTAQDLAPGSTKRYIEVADLWCSWCCREAVDPYRGDYRLMTRWLTEVSRGRQSSTIRTYIIGLRKLYKYFIAAGLTRSNPSLKLILPKVHSAEVNPFSEAELAALLAACRTAKERAAFYLMLGGGLRIAEIGTITTEDIDYETGVIRIYGKGRKWRAIAPGSEAMKHLRLAMFGKTRLDIQPDYLDYQIKRWGRAASITSRVHAHRFRYTFAVQFLENGGAIDELQTILGHSTIGMSMHYSRYGRELRALKAQQRFNPADRLHSTAS